MKKPELLIESAPQDNFIEARCSSCEDFRFRVEGNSLSNKTLVRGVFDLHYKLTHLREDSGQVPAEPH